MTPNSLFDTDTQVRPLPSVAPGLCAGQLRRYAAVQRASWSSRANWQVPRLGVIAGISLILVGFAGCSGMPPDQYEKYLADPAALRLVVEVCLPSVNDGVSGVAISLTENDGTTRGDSLNHAYPAGVTEKGERVFLLTDSNRPKDVLAITVLNYKQALVNIDGEQFIYSVPRDLRHKEFSPWHAPKIVHTRTADDARYPTFLRLLNGDEVSTIAIPQLAPKLRFTTLTTKEQSEYFDALVVKKKRTSRVPACM